MKTLPITACLALALLVPSLSAAPQGRAGEQPEQRGQQQGTMQGNENMQEMHDQMMQGGMQDRQGMMNRDHMRGEHRAMFGDGLMSEEERAQFRERLQAAETQQERDRLMAEHREEMMQRANDRGMDLEGNPVFGWNMMTREEREQFMDQQQRMEQDRVNFLQQHRDQMMKRARQRDVSLEEDGDEG